MMKRILSVLLLACVLVGAMCVPAFAYEFEIEDLSDDFGHSGIYVDGVLDRYLSVQELASQEGIRPGTTYFIPLTRKDFDWVDDRQGTITRNTIDALGLELYIEDTKGNDMIHTIKLDEQYGSMGIYIRFRDTMKSFEREEFDITIKLLVHNAEYRGSTIRLRGTFANRQVVVRRYDTKCTLGPDRYAIAHDDVQNVKFHLGEGVTITSNIETSDKFYGYARERANENDKAAQQKYPQIVKVLEVYTLGFGGQVSFELVEDGPLYVYDDTLVYLGTTDNSVAYREKYYLASSKLA